jgi:hypothetical protein
MRNARQQRFGVTPDSLGPKRTRVSVIVSRPVRLREGAAPIRRVKRHRKKISSLVKCSPPNSGDTGVTQQTMNANDADISEESQRELALGDLKQSAQHELAAGVLKQAAEDLRRFHGATSTVERELYLDAYRWLTIDECSSPFSFLNVCQLLNLAPENVRQELIGDLSLGPLSCWMRRCGRAARRFQISVGQLFVSERNASGAYSYESVN